MWYAKYEEILKKASCEFKDFLFFYYFHHLIFSILQHVFSFIIIINI